MKRCIYSLIFLSMLSLLIGCPNPDDQTVPGVLCPTTNKGNVINIGPEIKISDQEIVVSINKDIKISDDKIMQDLKNKVIQRMNLDTVNKPKILTKACKCGDPFLQLWTFDNPILDIETKVGGLAGGPGENELEGDLQFAFVLPSEGDGIPVDTSKFDSIRELIKDGTGRVNIAILDTGLDLSRLETSRLYQNPNSLGADCGAGWSGWNFVNNSPDIQDDHANVGHGTLVTKTIMNPLDRDGIDYRILPLKVFNSQGEGTYWDIVCAMSYLQKIQDSTGGDIQIVNASFGGTFGNLPKQRIKFLEESIDMLENTALVVTSAGNCHFDTDDPMYQHYPSGYNSENILSVGGFDIVDIRFLLHDNSNYGNFNVDVAANFDHTLNLDINNDGTMDQVKLSGTSYSAAYISSQLAQMLGSGPPLPGSATDWKDVFLSTRTSYSQDLNPFIGAGRYVP